MNYYNEIKNILIDNEICSEVKNQMIKPKKNEYTKTVSDNKEA